jgi:hypothetical protein
MSASGILFLIVLESKISDYEHEEEDEDDF